MRIHNLYKWFTLCFTIFVLLIPVAKAQINPQLLKDEAEIYPLVYFGMPLDEFKQKLSTRIFECKPNPNKAADEHGCKISFRFAGSSMSDGVGLFKSGKLVAFIARINTDFYPAVTQAVQSSLGTNPQVEPKTEKKGFFSSKVENEYSIWSFPNYQIAVSKFDIPRYEEGGNNYSLIVESADKDFNQKMRDESRKKPGFEVKVSDTNAPIDKDSIAIATVSPTQTSQPEPTVIPSVKAQSNTPEPKQVKPVVKQSNNRLKSKIKRTYDEFRKQSEYTGEDVLDGFGEVFSRAVKPDNSAPIFQIYVADLYQGPWRYYRTTWDSDGTKLDTLQITRNVVSCGGWECYRNEEVALIITRDYLEQHRTKGLRFKLSGSGGEYIFTVPAAHIDAFLDVVN